MYDVPTNPWDQCAFKKLTLIYHPWSIVTMQVDATPQDLT